MLFFLLRVPPILQICIVVCKQQLIHSVAGLNKLSINIIVFVATSFYFLRSEALQRLLAAVHAYGCEDIT